MVLKFCLYFQVVSILSILCIIASICCFCLGTHSYFQSCPKNPDPVLGNFSTNGTSGRSGISEIVNAIEGDVYENDMFHECDPIQLLEYIQLVCNSWFTFEVLVRFMSCPTKTAFFRAPINLLDVAATAIFYSEEVSFHI